MAKRILIVEDNNDVNSLLCETLEAEGYEIVSLFDGFKAIRTIKNDKFDIIILDIMLPYKSGDEILRELREFSDVPVIIISAKDTIVTKIDLLKLGADDYITKPFGTSELLARIRTALRHSAKRSPNHIFTAKGLVIDFDGRLIHVMDKEVHLTQIEFKLISLLAQNAGKVLTYDFMITSIWGPYADKNNQILRVNMANIRRKIEQNPGDPKYIFTEVGVGYRMIEEDSSL